MTTEVAMPNPSAKPSMLSFRAQPPKVPAWSGGICFFLFFCAALSAGAQTERPRILGIWSAATEVTDYCGGIDFYSKLLGHSRDNRTECPSPGQTTTHYGASFQLRPGQQLNVGSFGTPNPYKIMNQFGLATDDLPGMLKFLKSHGIDTMPGGKFGLISVEIQDPEGHHIIFMQSREKPDTPRVAVSPYESPRIIHVGFIVTNKTKMEHFYEDILGFRPYWHGGMKDDQTDWISLQVPDGTDWVEFMLNVPENADQRLRGVMNHIALGVPDIQKAREQLVKNGVQLSEEPQIGRDGKWQLNIYDPDGTRVEFMEFKPVQSPCCSEYTGPHPKP